MLKRSRGERQARHRHPRPPVQHARPRREPRPAAEDRRPRLHRDPDGHAPVRHREAATRISGNMFWAYGQQILAAAEFVRHHPNLYGIYFTNFCCGPDSFLLSFAEEMMGAKPFLSLELDEHGGDAGYLTRIEAFLDVIRAWTPREQPALPRPRAGSAAIEEFKQADALGPEHAPDRRAALRGGAARRRVRARRIAAAGNARGVRARPLAHARQRMPADRLHHRHVRPPPALARARPEGARALHAQLRRPVPVRAVHRPPAARPQPPRPGRSRHPLAELQQLLPGPHPESAADALERHPLRRHDLEGRLQSAPVREGTPAPPTARCTRASRRSRGSWTTGSDFRPAFARGRPAHRRRARRRNSARGRSSASSARFTSAATSSPTTKSSAPSSGSAARRGWRRWANGSCTPPSSSGGSPGGGRWTCPAWPRRT